MVEVWFTSTEGRGLTTATYMPTALEPVDIEDYEAGMVEYMVDKVCSLLQRTGLPNKRLYDICNLAGRKFLK